MLLLFRVFPPVFPDYEVWQSFHEPRVDRSKESFTWGNLDVEKIVVFLDRHAGLSREAVRRNLIKHRIDTSNDTTNDYLYTI